MIYYVVSAGEAQHFKALAGYYLRALAARMVIIPYWRLAMKRTLHPGRKPAEAIFGSNLSSAYEAIDTREGGEPYRVSLARRLGLVRSVLAARIRRKLYVLGRRSIRKRLTAAGLYLEINADPA